MANPPRIRKRVHAVRRAPDGSAFEKCDNCGASVPIALADMHECEAQPKTAVKRFKGLNGKQNIVERCYSDQPRSPFRIFMEDFMNTCKKRKLIDIDRKGFEIWRNMSKEERQPYVNNATKVNLAYLKSLIQEVHDSSEVDEEADSAMVGKFDPKLKVRNRLLIRNSYGFDENGSVNGFPITPNKFFVQEAIGAEYGEGFETFRQDGPLKVDVQQVFMQECLLFSPSLEEMKGLLWNILLSLGKEIPDDGYAQRLMLYAGADHVWHKALHWETAESEVDRLKLRLSQLYYYHLLRLRESIEGLKEWLDAAVRAGIPCAVVSSLDRINMAIVAEEDGMESIAHRFLSAGLKLDRKPSKCVVFEDDPRGITTAHNCTMMAVALIGTVAEPKTASVAEPLLLNAVRGENVERPPVWLMRQAGRYMKSYQTICEKYPSFRERSENVDLVVEISLQPWNVFKPDGVILFSDILTPLSGMNIPFDIVKGKGPVIFNPLHTAADVDQVREFVPEESVPYVGKSLTILRKEVDNKAAVLGFVGAPFTLASYVVEGGSSKHFSKIKRLAFSEPKVLHALLQKFATSMAKYIQYQAKNGAQAVQIFDSWATELSPVDFEEFSLPYLKQIVDTVRKTHPNLPLILYASGSGGLLERLALTGVDVVSLDWTVDMAEGRRRLGPNLAVQGNVDPGVLFGSKEFITNRINDVVRKAGKGKHILNLGHGIIVGTPEENVAHFFEVAKGIRY
ncbi:hypothetical protein GH714_037829 [Hevea brasiliensis]|uniref:Uroporphyrinogen decarboxylase n=1 Tax=Hevea brasiliensis TaxID=3981 RepID=A0A6A6L7J9_HEVBR|nr:hypothetical protein GH714_037829 [Hevea brasiliensis]